MSLLMWLPLDGNLNNQTAENITVTNFNSTYDTVNGKIGTCVDFDYNNNHYIKGPKNNTLFNDNDDFTLAFWVYIKSYPTGRSGIVASNQYFTETATPAVSPFKNE